CHLDSQLLPCTLQDTIISLTADVCHTSQNTQQEAFDCALSGPFDNLFFIRLAPYPDSLWKHNYLYLRLNGLCYY
ncbi:MAG: hypothetical protein IJY74_02545, partial [Oscillospiraceae bacterium]|nr:hypothetical protein [Oscillospiraceae bacterium]